MKQEKCLSWPLPTTFWYSDEEEVQHQVDFLHEYLGGLGMAISRDKSQTFQVVAKRDTWTINERTIKLGKASIPTADPDQAFRYLAPKWGLGEASTVA